MICELETHHEAQRHLLYDCNLSLGELGLEATFSPKNGAPTLLNRAQSPSSEPPRWWSDAELRPCFSPASSFEFTSQPTLSAQAQTPDQLPTTAEDENNDAEGRDLLELLHHVEDYKEDDSEDTIEIMPTTILFDIFKDKQEDNSETVEVPSLLFPFSFSDSLLPSSLLPSLTFLIVSFPHPPPPSRYPRNAPRSAHQVEPERNSSKR